MRKSLFVVALFPLAVAAPHVAGDGRASLVAEAHAAPETYTGAVKCEDPEVKAAVVQYLGTGAGVPTSVKAWTSLSDAKKPWKVGAGPYRLDVPISAFWRTLTSFPSTQRGTLRVSITQNHGANGAAAAVNVAFCQFHRKKGLSDWGKAAYGDVFLTGSKYFKYPKGGTGQWSLEMPDTSRTDVDDSRVVVAVFDVGGSTGGNFSFNFELSKW
jgi:hypothetical protein